MQAKGQKEPYDQTKYNFEHNTFDRCNTITLYSTNIIINTWHILYYLFVTHIAPSNAVPGELGTWTSQTIEANIFFIVYAGKVYSLDDPNLPKDKTYQTIIPGTRRVIDASHGPKIGTGHTINQSFIDERLNVRAYACSKSPTVILNACTYYLFFVEGNKNIVLYKSLKKLLPRTECLAGYGRDYWCYEDQFIKLSEEDKMLCSEYYKIDPETDLI